MLRRERIWHRGPGLPDRLRPSIFRDLPRLPGRNTNRERARLGDGCTDAREPRRLLPFRALRPALRRNRGLVESLARANRGRPEHGLPKLASVGFDDPDRVSAVARAALSEAAEGIP